MLNVKGYVPKDVKEVLSPLYKKYFFTKLMIESKLNLYSTIREINVEFANFCNLRCKWCSLNHSKEKVILNEQIFEKLLKDLVYDRRFKLVKNLNLWNAGEVLLNKYIVNLLKLLKRYKDMGIKRNGYFPKISLLTNGIFLTKDMSIKIIEINVIDKLIFSVDGGSIKKYEEIRRGAKWSIISNNINTLKKMNGNRIITEIICMVDPKKPLNQDWMKDDFKNVLEKVDVVSLRHPHNWDGSVNMGIKKDDKIKKGCYFLMCQLVLLPNGDVTVCCADLNSRGVIGNILKNSLFEIYRCDKRRKMIKLNLSGNRNKIPLCQNCDIQ